MSATAALDLSTDTAWRLRALVDDLEARGRPRDVVLRELVAAIGSLTAVHVVPVNDQIHHEDAADCPCGPRRYPMDGPPLLVHNSLDGREHRSTT